MISVSIKKLNLFQLLTSAPYLQPTNTNSSSKYFQDFLILSSNLKSENALVFLKHLSVGLLREQEEDTSLNKLFVNVRSFLINKCFFVIGGIVFKKGTDPAPFRANLCLFESKYIKQLISNRSSKAYKYHGGLDSLTSKPLFLTRE